MPLSTPVVPAALIVPPASVNTATAAAWPAVNRAVYTRFQLGVATVARYLLWEVGTASGNVQLGVVRLSGAGRTSYARVMNSGVIACPSTGAQRTDLGATLLAAGDYALFLWADNTTVTTRYVTNAAFTSLKVCGLENSLTTGVGASGTITYTQGHVTAVLEGDV